MNSIKEWSDWNDRNCNLCCKSRGNFWITAGNCICNLQKEAATNFHEEGKIPDKDCPERINNDSI